MYEQNFNLGLISNEFSFTREIKIMIDFFTR